MVNGNLGGLRPDMLYQDPGLPYGYRDDLSWGPVVRSATPARDFVSMPEDYAAVYADIPEEHRRSIATPYGTVAAHSATYDPYSVGRKVSRGAVTGSPSDERGTPEYSGPKYKYTPSNGSFKRELENPVDGDQRMEGDSIYTWVDGGWQYHGESGTPDLVNKDQFVKNYYEQKATVEQQIAANDIISAVPPSVGYTPPATDWSNILNIGSRWNPLWGSGGLWTSAPQVGDNAYMDELANTYLRMAGQ